jgi:hypothetical protein
VLWAAVLEAKRPTPPSGSGPWSPPAQPEAEVFEAPFRSVMIAHTGPDLVGLAWWWEARDRTLTT